MKHASTNNSQEKKLSAKEKGEIGEHAINTLLEGLEPEYRLIKDVHLRTYESTTPVPDSTQIDQVLLSIYGIFVIETKNWDGHGFDIFTDEEWTQKFPTKLNPFLKAIKQNEWHLKVLANRIEIDVNFLFSIIVFAGDARIPRKLEGVCYKKNLEHYIRSNFKKKLLTRKQIESFYTAIQEHNIRIHDENYKEKHDKFYQTRKSIRDGKVWDDKTNKPPRQKATLDDKFTGAKSDYFKKSRKFIGYGFLAAFSMLLLGILVHLFQSQNSNTETIRPHQDVENSTDDSIFPQPSLTETPSISPAQDDARIRFIQQLADYENDIEPKIDGLRLPEWAAEKYAELEQLKKRAIEDFANGEYLLARASLQQAHTMVTELSAEYVGRLLTLRQQAYAAFENNHAPEAEQAIQQVLRMSPEDAEMRALQKRVTVLPQVLDLLRQAEVAQHENRPEKEMSALQKVLSLDSSRRLLNPRLEKLQAQQKQQQFAIALDKAQRALDVGNLAAATKQIDLAKTIFPTNKALASIQKQLQQAQIEHEFEKQILLGEQAQQQDQWQVADKHFQRALQLKPNHKTALENHNIAQQIMDISERISRALAQQHRLADETIVNNTAAYLRDVESIVTRSARLQEAHAELARQVVLYKTEVEVTVISDNKTDIIVRAQGQVGKTLRRTILLRPGKRVFEGSRRGYKSKLVTLDIKPRTALSVTIICDEKI